MVIVCPAWVKKVAEEQIALDVPDTMNVVHFGGRHDQGHGVTFW
jgi:hypothetical protein